MSLILTDIFTFLSLSFSSAINFVISRFVSLIMGFVSVFVMMTFISMSSLSSETRLQVECEDDTIEKGLKKFRKKIFLTKAVI